jgi:prepilin-type N-terminal cleavage/methylation domain-containing protein
VRPRALHGEEGFSLAEVLVTIVIVGVTFAALLGGLFTSISVSSLHRKQAAADALARSAAEWVKDSVANPYVPCATSGTYSFSTLPVPSGFSVSIPVPPAVGVENWNPVGTVPVASSYSPQFEPSQSGCTDHGLQRITIVVRSSDSQVVETVQVLKRVVS